MSSGLVGRLAHMRTLPYHERALNNYFIPCHRKYSDQHNQINVTYLWCMKGRLGVLPFNVQQPSCVLIGYVFFGIV